jgi:hypothetical protein
MITFFRPLGNPLSWPVYRTEYSSYYWPAADVGGRSYGCRADGPPNLPHARLLAVPYVEVFRTVDR